AVDVVGDGCGPGVSGNDRVPEPDASGLSQPAVDTTDSSDFACQADLSDCHQIGRDGFVACGGCDRDGDGEVGRWVSQPRAADGSGVDIDPVQGHAAAFAQHRLDHGDSGGVDATGRVPGCTGDGLSDERLDLCQQWPASFHRNGHAGA